MIALCAIAIFAVRDHAREDSITIDETVHLFAGAEYVMLGTYFSNPEHPPLTKDLAALNLLRADPQPPLVRGFTVVPPKDPLLRFLWGNRIAHQSLLAMMRQPFRWLLALLIVVVYLAARDAWGTGAAVLASALVALDPNLIAHAGIVHTDVAATLLMTATAALTIAAVGTTGLRWVFAGIVLGLAISAKFTALLLVPLVLLAPLLVLLEKEWTRKALVEQFAGALAACILAALTVYCVYAVSMRHMHPDDAAASVSAFLRSRGVEPDVAARYERITRAEPRAGLFLAGIKGVAQLNAKGRGWNFLHGRVSQEGFPHYFFVAFLLKSTPSMLLVTALILAGARRLRTKWAIGLLAPAVILFAVSIPSSFNIGVRHILPIYPLLAITGAGVLAQRLRPRTYAAVAAALIGGAAISLGSSHPHELGYFNALARGEGRQWLGDSNIDWGQDIGRLRSYLKAKGWERDTNAIVFRTVVHEPELEGLETFIDEEPAPGRYAVSAHMEQVGPAMLRSFGHDPDAASLEKLFAELHARGRKIDTVGSSFTIWDLPSRSSSPIR